MLKLPNIVAIMVALLITGLAAQAAAFITSIDDALAGGPSDTSVSLRHAGALSLDIGADEMSGGRYVTDLYFTPATPTTFTIADGQGGYQIPSLSIGSFITPGGQFTHHLEFSTSGAQSGAFRFNEGDSITYTTSAGSFSLTPTDTSWAVAHIGGPNGGWTHAAVPESPLTSIACAGFLVLALLGRYAYQQIHA